MTEVVVTSGAGPRLHAFVVGVAHYPYLGRGGGSGAALRLLDDLDQITVPEYSAAEVAQWLLARPKLRNDLPLGTVEVLISTPGPQPAAVQQPDGATIEVENADFANFRAGFRRWREHCASDRGNIAIFYFCGHGWHHGDQLLLLEDVGADPGVLLEHSVDLGEIRAAMHRTGPYTQAYFVDACRELPLDLLASGSRPGQVADAPVPAGPLPHIDAPVFFSTALGHSALGAGGKPTPYTLGVLAGLDGLGAKRGNSNDAWVVTTGSLADRLYAILEWEQPGAPEQHVRIEGQLAGRGVLRSMTQPPMVPFRVACVPESAPLPEQVIAYPETTPGSERSPQVFAAPSGRLAAGIYKIRPGYPAESGIRAAEFWEVIATPNTVLNVTTDRS